MWPQIIIMIVAMVVAYATRPKPKSAKPASIGDFDMPVVEEGTEQAVFFGDCWITGWQVLSYGSLRTTKVQTKSGK